MTSAWQSYYDQTRNPVRSSSSSQPRQQTYGDVYSSSRTNPNRIPDWNSQKYAELGNVLSSVGVTPNQQTLSAINRDYVNTVDWGSTGGGGSMPSGGPSFSGGGGGGGGYGFGGGGGGGGGGGPSGLTQAQMDWMANLLKGGTPDARTASVLDLPNYQGKFRGGKYDRLMNKFNQGIKMDRQTANQAYRQLGQNLRADYSNPFTNKRATYATMPQAPGMDQQAMARMMQSQGVDPTISGAQLEGAAGADQAFKNLWGVLAANENLAQRNRLRTVGQDRNTTQRALDIAALQGRTGIGLQKAGALDEWRTRADEIRQQIAQQEALANWQRGNEVTDLNATDANSYRNQVIQALISSLPSVAQGVKMPSVADLFPRAAAPKAGRRGGKGGGRKGGKK